MEEHRFDDLVLNAAQQTTRRAALGAILGGALLLRQPAASEANDKAKRRKKRHRKQARGASLKPISVWVDNTGGVTPYTGSFVEGSCCTYLNTVNVAPGTRQVYRSRVTIAYLWLNGKYAIGFQNDYFKPPLFMVGMNGVLSGGSSCCGLPVGQTVVWGRGLKAGQSSTFMLDGQSYTIRRNNDTNYKEFTLYLPAVQ
ncbi:MAG: hypothetical protein QM692_22305 [Thermomicrobiales bacterium]